MDAGLPERYHWRMSPTALPESPKSPPAARTSGQRLWSAAALVSLLGAIAVNGLANALPINGLTTGAVSDGYRIYFVPAGYTFSIWGLIYLALLAFGVAQAVLREADAVVGPARWLFVLSCFANGAWIFAWHHLQLGVSVLLMLTLLGSLVALYRQLHRTPPAALRPLARWTLVAPIRLYLGWICVATVPNVAAFLWKLGWTGQPLEGATWAAVMMGVATAIVVALAVRFRDSVAPLVVVWALVGIMAKFPEELAMRTVGGVMVVVLVGTAGWVLWRLGRDRGAPASA